ncbi:metallopeptidase TldD-related protein [Pseudactinotalea terrae]|uniref:metallopeptidase TldD-related protein n=1 Tax=Pseudactinotalea terrae TaxID=1743262 RepID=UPI0019D57D9A|nr:metallopeptidase TldD-related protein [Pseudactinotalea terrae]
MSPADAAARAVEAVATRLPGAEVVAFIERSEEHLTRFASSAIHQNVADDAWSARVTAHSDGRTLTLTSGLAGAGDGAAIEALAARVADSLALAPRDPRWAGVAHAAPVPPTQEQAGSTPAERAAAVAAFIEGAGGLSASGYVKSYRSEAGVATSGGQSASMCSAASSVDGIATLDGVDGVSRSRVRTHAELDPHAAGALAAAKARAGKDAIELPPGRYEVILEPAAAVRIVSTLAMYGFNGRLALDGASFVEPGLEQLDPSITLIDDGPAWGVTVDAEGTPKQRQRFVDAGVSVQVAHDRRTAAEAGASSTGHGFGVGMPVAAHLGIEPGPAVGVAGDPTVAGPVARAAAPLLDGVERALLVSDFWYTRVLDPRQVTVTGLTRNGMWLIEDGEVRGAVQNVRFTQSYPGALAPGQVLGVGPVAVTDPDSWSATAHSAPALRLASWNVTGNASG